MSNTKKQHYVPQFYLRYFSLDQGTIFVYDKYKERDFKTNIGKVAQERYFYKLPITENLKKDLEEDDKDRKYLVEKALSHFDGFHSGVLWKFFSNLKSAETLSLSGFPRIILTDQQKYDLSSFAIIQDLRTKKTREELAQMNYMLTESIYEFIGEKKFSDFDMNKLKIEMPEGFDTIRQLELLFNKDHVNGVSRVLTFNKVWILGVNRTERPLIISDHPIIQKSHDPKSSSSGGWISPYMEIVIPLSPKYILIIICPLLLRKKEFEFGAEFLLDSMTTELTGDQVDYYNSLQCCNAYRFLYSERPDWEAVKRIIKDNPRLKNPIRQRVAVNGFGKKRTLPDGWRKK